MPRSNAAAYPILMRMKSSVAFQQTCDGIDWSALKSNLTADNFDNGRTPEQLERSFRNSAVVSFGLVDGRVIAKGRVLSDGVCNAYLVDLWTLNEFRGQGIAREVVRRLSRDLHGQHVYLQADDDLVSFYEGLGFRRHPNGMALVVGQWLKNDGSAS